jgi:hypothetical protein
LRRHIARRDPPGTGGQSGRSRASYWDALLVATAAEAGCTLVLTEDMANGAMLGGVTVHHPFAGDNLTQLTQELLDG